MKKKAQKSKVKAQKKPTQKVAGKTKTSVQIANIVSSKNSLMPKIVPLGSRVLIKPFTKEELEKKNSFGIILPESDAKEKTEQGKVLAVGPGDVDDGVRVPLIVQPGDIVAFSKYGYDEVSMDGEEYYLIKEENILAILK
jgi:chaperonin GroES